METKRRGAELQALLTDLTQAAKDSNISRAGPLLDDLNGHIRHDVDKPIQTPVHAADDASTAEEVRLALGAFGGIGALTFTIQRLVEDAGCVRVAGEGLIGLFQCSQNRELLPKQGAEAITSALEHHGSCAAIQGTLLRALVAACTKSEKNKRIIHSCGVNAIIVSCLTTYKEGCKSADEGRGEGEERKTLSAAWALLRVLISDDDRREGVQPNTFVRARELAENVHRGVVRPLLAPIIQQQTPTMTAACAAELLQTLKLVAVNDLVCKHIKNCKGIEAVLEILLLHLPHAGVARHGCGVIKAVSRNDEIKQYVGKGDGLGVVLKAMEEHASAPLVIEQGLAAMSVLSLRHPDNCDRISQLGAIQLMTSLMENHPQQAGVQRQAISTLRNMVSDWKNKELVQAILDAGAEPLIRNARSLHPVCEEVAYAALRDLGLSYHTA